MQEGIQVDGAHVVLPQPVSAGPTPPVGTVTNYAADGEPPPCVLLASQHRAINCF